MYDPITPAQARELLARRQSFGPHNQVNRALSTILQQDEDLTRLRAEAAALFDEAATWRQIMYVNGFRMAGAIDPVPGNPYRKAESDAEHPAHP